MAKIVYDRFGHHIGKIEERGSITMFYDEYGHQIGKIQPSGSSIFLYDRYGHQIAKFDGKNTYDKYGHQMGRGNLFLQIVYPNMARIG